LQARGYAGSYYAVRRQLARWRSAQLFTIFGSHSGTTMPILTERASARLVADPNLARLEAARTAVSGPADRLQDCCPEIRLAGKLAPEFAHILRDRNESAWNNWLERNWAEGVPRQLRELAEGLRNDEAAVRAVMKMEWSNGQVEGQVTRLTTIKRQMYGRAKFDLFQIRVLEAARITQLHALACPDAAYFTESAGGPWQGTRS
jgi:hypothetical protein